MPDRSKLRRRRNWLVRSQGGRCHWCSVKMTPTEWPMIDTSATLDHLYSRNHPLRGTPRSHVAACFKCNSIRSGIQSKNPNFEGAPPHVGTEASHPC